MVWAEAWYFSSMTAKDKTTLSQVNANKVHGTFFSKHHVDLPLLFGLFLALCFSLFVLYSASGQEIDMLTRQVTRTGAAFLLMIAVAITQKQLLQHDMKKFLKFSLSPMKPI